MTTRVTIYGSSVADSLDATFYTSDGTLQVGGYGDNVLASVQLTPDAGDEEIQAALKHVLGAVGEEVWNVAYERSDLDAVDLSDIPIVEVLA